MSIRDRHLMMILTTTALLFAPLSLLGQQTPFTTGQTSKGADQKEAPAASKVTVEVKKGEGKDAPEVKVQVEGNTDPAAITPKSPEPTNILPLPGEKLAPLETEQIEKAAQKVGQKVDEIELRLGLKLGSWVWTEAFLGITWFKLFSVILAIIFVAFLERCIRWLINRRLSKSRKCGEHQEWTTLLLGAAKKPLSLFILVYGFYAAISPLFDNLDKSAYGNQFRGVTGILTDLLGTVVVLWLLYRLLEAIERPLVSKVFALRGIDDLLIAILGRFLRILIVTLGAIFLIQNLTGLELGPVLASLGLGGLAVALAAKDSISNFFGTLTIIFDKPFQVGDHIRLDKYEGVVESIGFRSALIRTLDGALVSIPNEKAISFGVENLGRREALRWHTNIGIRYDTPVDKVARAVEILREILNDEKHVDPDQPPRVFLDGFNHSSLNISVSVWYRPVIWWDFQAWRQDKCLRILSEFEKEGIRLAYPTRALLLEDKAPKDDWMITKS